MSKTLYEGIARGGPLDGRKLISRCLKGLLVVDRPHQLAWIYDWKLDEFVIREGYENGMPLTEGRHRTAEEPDYDVIAWTG